MLEKMYLNVLLYRTCFVFRIIMPLCFISHSVVAQENEDFPSIIPLPAQCIKTGPSFDLVPSTSITINDSSLTGAAALLNLYITGIIHHKLLLKNIKSSNSIILSIDTLQVTSEEGYYLQINNKNIYLVGHDVNGIIHGIQTIRQLWVAPGTGRIRVPGCIIRDHPRFSYRGMHLDVSRHIFPVAFIKKFIDLLAFYKFNTFHWHLTDDQGWRIEIKKYPLLQSVAAWRSETLKGHKKETPHTFDGKKYGGYYTQNEIKDLVQYAEKRSVRIIPEIEMPGHALAALAAYPYLGCNGGPYKTATYWGVFDDVFCAGNDSVFVFIQNVLDEVIALFPSKYIHIGGDECPKKRWMACVKCQRRISSLNLEGEEQLQRYFVHRIEQYLKSRGRSVMGWDEILEGGPAPDATIMSWRGEAIGIEAAMQKHQVIMTPERYLYFDYYQSLSPQEPLAAGGYTPLSRVYAYEPVPDSLSPDAIPYIKGVQGQLWSEYITSGAEAEYMLFPRMMALAETGWTQRSLRGYTGFLERLRRQKKLLGQMEVRYADTFDEITYSVKQSQGGPPHVSLFSTMPGSTIRWSADGTAPCLKSSIYKKPLTVKKSCIIKAIVYNSNNQPSGRMFSLPVTLHKATGSKVSLTYPATARFNPGAECLVNGLSGNDRYNNDQWLGSNGDDFEVIIDLGRTDTIHNIGLHFLHYPWQRMWGPDSLQFAVSSDGKTFREVYSGVPLKHNGINLVKEKIPAERTRFIKVRAKNKGLIPVNEYGEGSRALLMVDEIIIN